MILAKYFAIAKCDIIPLELRYFLLTQKAILNSPLAARRAISLGVSRISLRSNIARRKANLAEKTTCHKQVVFSWLPLERLPMLVIYRKNIQCSHTGRLSGGSRPSPTVYENMVPALFHKPAPVVFYQLSIITLITKEFCAITQTLFYLQVLNPNQIYSLDYQTPYMMILTILSLSKR